MCSGVAWNCQLKHCITTPYLPRLLVVVQISEDMLCFLRKGRNESKTNIIENEGAVII